jgi:hypothetical protein
MKITTYNDHRSAPFPEPWSFNSNQVYSVEGADAVISSAKIILVWANQSCRTGCDFDPQFVKECK